MAETTRDEVRRVLLVTLVLNLLVAAGKIVIGTISGALAISADGFHSLMDGAANGVALVANRVAAQPADEDHPYGHRRYETLAALGIGVLLVFTALEIGSDALARLQTPQTPDVSPLTLLILVATLMVNLFTSTYERRVGRRLNSELLLADAANTGADVFVTLSVLASMGLVALGLPWADPLAALLIVGLIGRAAWQVLRQTGQVLVDTAPFPAETLRTALTGLPGEVERVRSRGPRDAPLVDLDVRVPAAMTTEATAALAEALQIRLRERLQLTGGEITVRFVPSPANATPDYPLQTRSIADALGLRTHAVHVNPLAQGDVLEVHVEVPAGQTVADAHAQVSEFERRLRAALPQLHGVVSHIEPAPQPSTPLPGEATEHGDLCDQAFAVLTQYNPRFDWHDLRCLRLADGYGLTLHVTMPAVMPLDEAHAIAEEAERVLRRELPALTRITIHTEPGE